MTANRMPIPTSARQRGFTLVEVAVSLFVTVTILLGVLALFDFSNKLSRAQTSIADMQQSMRVGQADVMRLVRMAGRGGLPVGTLPQGAAVEVRDNVGSDQDWNKTRTTIGGDDTPTIVPGTDVLTVRGVFSTPLYQVNSAAPGAFTLSPAGAPTGGTIQISDTTPTGIPQDLSALKDAVQGPDDHPHPPRHEALLLVSARSSAIWAVVELAGGAVAGSTATLNFSIGGGVNTAAYSRFSSSGPGVFPPELTSVAFVGILEEYRFYVRQDYSTPGDATTDLVPRLSRARTFPGTDVPWGNPDTSNIENWHLDVADNICDLQVSLGFDTPTGGSLSADEVNGSLTEAANGENDDWMYNGEAATNYAAFAGSDLLYVRLSTLARTDKRDYNYVAPDLVRMEDHSYTSSAFNTRNEKMYRRRILRTIIDMRNLG